MGRRPEIEPERVADPEGELLLRCRADPAAFGVLYDRTHTAILRYFLLRTACAATSADLCSETFAGALEGLGRYDPDKGTGRAWMHGIARHVLQQYHRTEDVSRRARMRVGLRYSSDDFVDLDRIDDLVDFRPRVAAITAALHLVPENLRDAIVLRIVDQLSYEEIAGKLGCSIGNARVRVSRGLDRLESLLESP